MLEPHLWKMVCVPLRSTGRTALVRKRYFLICYLAVIFFLKVRRFSRIDEKSSLNLTLYLQRITPREINSNRFHYRIDIEQS